MHWHIIIEMSCKICLVPDKSNSSLSNNVPPLRFEGLVFFGLQIDVRPQEMHKTHTRVHLNLMESKVMAVKTVDKTFLLMRV